jgi:polar amino acid transport system substrate-binding protein
MTAGVALTLAALGFLLALGGCRFPDDVEGTLERVEGGTMRVGVVADPPWVTLGKRDPRGVEPQLIRRFAEQLDAEIEWIEGTEADLVDALGGFQIDVLIGGLTRASPYSREGAFTRPYIDTNVEIGVPPGTELPDELGGVEIWVERGSEPAALLRQEEDDAVPLFFEKLSEIDGPALLDTYDLESIGYERTDYILRDDEHAMAVAPGENAFLVELEHFLLDQKPEAKDLLYEEVGR